MASLGWEEVKNAGAGMERGLVVWRAKVFGGWLVLADRGAGVSGLAFVPDPEHQWMM